MRSIVGDLLLLRLAEASAEPMNRRLYRGLREAILEGAIAADTRLPASRDLAAELGIARNTVVHVYSQLLAEGYTRSRQGNGTFVNASLPDSFLSSGRRARPAAAPQPRAALSPRGAAIVDGASASPYQWGAFMPGVPDLTEFPHRKFGRIVSALWRNPPPDLLTYAHGGGLPALREALAQHLALTRSIDCDPEQLIITEGSHQAIDLASRILGDPGEVAWVEDPGYWGARTVLQANGLRIRHLPVDEEGMQVPQEAGGEPPRFIFVTPSHQYPLGPVMSLARRRQLLAVARRHGSWIIEDDYDSEFRFSGRPIASLLGLEPDAPVIYMGTFSKTLYRGCAWVIWCCRAAGGGVPGGARRAVPRGPPDDACRARGLYRRRPLRRAHPPHADAVRPPPRHAGQPDRTPPGRRLAASRRQPGRAAPGADAAPDMDDLRVVEEGARAAC